MWRIVDWDKHFENHETRKLRALLWVKTPVNLAGDGYTELVNHEEGAAHLGIWTAIVEVAAQCNPRGTLLRSIGVPHDAASLSRITRLPERLFLDAMPRLRDIGWLSFDGDSPDKPIVPRQSPEESRCTGKILRIELTNELTNEETNELTNELNKTVLDVGIPNVPDTGTEFRDLYPSHRLDNLGAQYFIGADKQSEILRNLRLMVKSDEWLKDGGKFIPWASRWISEGKCYAKPLVVRDEPVDTMAPETAKRVRGNG